MGRKDSRSGDVKLLSPETRERRGVRSGALEEPLLKSKQNLNKWKLTESNIRYASTYCKKVKRKNPKMIYVLAKPK